MVPPPHQVFVLPVGVYHGVHPVDCLVLENFDRAAPYGTGSAKVGGNYAPVLQHSEAARAAGFGITLHLDSQTRTLIDEFSTSGFLGVLETSPPTLVVPDSSSVISSITSRSVQEIAAAWGWRVDVRPVPVGELARFTEVMAAGTAAALVPIRSVTMKSSGLHVEYCAGEDPGPRVLQLLKELKGIQTGVLEDRFGWLVKVVEEVDGAAS